MLQSPESEQRISALADGAVVCKRWRRYLTDLKSLAAEPLPLETQGRLIRVTGLVLEAAGLRVPVGSVCEIHQEGRGGASAVPVLAEVVGFAGERAYLMPIGEVQGLASGALIVPRPAPLMTMELARPRHPWRRIVDRTLHLPVGDGLVGRIVDAQGRPIDRKGPLVGVHEEPVRRRPIEALDRAPVRTPLATGVRAIDALLTVGRGQRIGLFAPSDVDKSTLLGMMARHSTADVVVVGLIGERGREVKQFVEDIVGEEAIRRSVVVAAPADATPLARLQGASYATVIAEHFRDRGRHVLLLIDSLTHYAMAQREIATAIGETTPGQSYPPSCFAKLSQLVERSGNGRPPGADGGGGSITAFYTVVPTDDDAGDPIAGAACSVLDGRIVLARDIDDAGHFPAIDIERSVSRVMSSVAAADHLDAARRFRQLHARYLRARGQIQLGVYVPGQDADLDLAVRLHEPMRRLLEQNIDEPARFDDSLAYLHAVLAA